MTITDSTFRGNEAGGTPNPGADTGTGGAIVNAPGSAGGEMTITDSRFMDNKAVTNGGAIYNKNGIKSLRAGRH